jgi:hypothetical protein
MSGVLYLFRLQDYIHIHQEHNDWVSQVGGYSLQSHMSVGMAAHPFSDSVDYDAGSVIKHCTPAAGDMGTRDWPGLIVCRLNHQGVA